MIISMRPHATREEIDHVRERIAEFGYRVHSIDGEERVVIGVVGVGDSVGIWRVVTRRGGGKPTYTFGCGRASVLHIAERCLPRILRLATRRRNLVSNPRASAFSTNGTSGPAPKYGPCTWRSSWVRPTTVGQSTS